jgi:tetratricopeptide (TPR) repeat protein
VKSGVAVLLLVLIAGVAAPARGQAVDEAEWRRLRAVWDPAADDVRILVGLAGEASDARDLPRFQAFLDSVVRGDEAGPNALRYWGALALQLGASPDSVTARLAASLDDDTAVATLEEYVGLLEAHGAVNPALGLLEEAARAGVPAGRVALVRGRLLAGTGDRDAAVDAWLLAIGAGGEEAIAGAAGIGDLAEDGRGVPDGTLERVASLREVAEGDAAAAVAMLAVRLHAADGRWADAREAADDPALDGVAGGEALRAIAGRAREAGELGPARDALAALVALGPPAARAEDRLALGEVEDALGNPSAAAASFEQARVGGAPGASAREIAAELEAARASGDPEVLGRAVDEAIAAGADPAILAVPLGDLLLSRSSPDSAIAAYAAGIDEGPVVSGELEALSRVRLVQALAQSGSPASVAGDVGDALVRAPADPAAASARLADLAATLGAADTLDVARSLVLALAAEWRGRAGDPAGASADLERAAAEAKSAGETPALLLAAGRWAEAAGDTERARRLWRSVVDDHANTPYALDARRRLAEGG